ncbi:MAG: hypothetical protein PHG47_07605 [Sulfuricella sp.]|nr:hypothetical protein [Sulfuricella sp.]
MDRLRHIYQLHQILKVYRHPVVLCTFQEKLECSRASANRISARTITSFTEGWRI